MKSEWDYETFISYLGHILAYNKIPGGEFCFDRLYRNPKRKIASFNKFVRITIRRNYSYSITKREYQSLINGDCYICGIKKAGGIDRFDNDQGYDLSNCRSCCGSCNRLKLTSSHEDLLARCETIYSLHYDQITPLESPFKKNKRKKTTKIIPT